MSEHQEAQKQENIKRYASTRHPTIAAAIAGTYSFTDIEKARQHLSVLSEHFVLSRQQEGGGDQGIILWIKGYELTGQEKKDGFTGNFACISIVSKGDGKFTLKTDKVASELKYHPQRKRAKHKHPNWGHPILRSVKKQRIYPTVEHAQNELQLLHEEYPDVTIPLTGKIYVIIYGRQYKPPAKKWILEIKVHDEGGFYIDAVPNDYQAPQERSKQPPGMEEEAADKSQQGYFTSMVELKRAKKKGAPPAADESAESES